MREGTGATVCQSAGWSRAHVQELETSAHVEAARGNEWCVSQSGVNKGIS